MTDGAVYYQQLSSASVNSEDAVRSLLVQSIRDPTVYFYAALRHHPKVIQFWKKEESEPLIQVLDTLSVGVMADLDRLMHSDALKSFHEEKQIITSKMKVLSLLSFYSNSAAGRSVVPLEALKAPLQCQTLEAVEEVILEAIDAGLWTGSIDEAMGCVRVQFASGRDVSMSEIEKMMEKLKQFQQICEAESTRLQKDC